MRAVRWILGIIAALVLLLATALISLTLLINPDHYRGELDRQVSQATGRPFVIDGHLRVSWFPWLAVRVGPAHLGAVPGQPGPQLIAWRSARLSVRLLPLLLHRRLQIGRIRLSGVDIHLWRRPDGRGNWRGLLTGKHSHAAPPTVSVIGGLRITDGTLHYKDGRGTTFTLRHWQLSVSAWQPGEPLAVSTRFVLQGGPLPLTGVPVQLRLRQVRLRSAPLTVSTPEVSLDVANVVMRGATTLRHGLQGFDGSGSLALAVPSVRHLVTLLRIKTRLPKDPNALGKFSLRGLWRLEDGALKIDPLTARLDATTLTGRIERSGGPQPLWRFALRADRIDVSRYLPPTGKHSTRLSLPVKALRALHARGTLTIERASLGGTVLKDIRLQAH